MTRIINLTFFCLFVFYSGFMVFAALFYARVMKIPLGKSAPVSLEC
jgi:hypothetical protein